MPGALKRGTVCGRTERNQGAGCVEKSSDRRGNVACGEPRFSLDTSALVRYLVEHAAKQSALAAALVNRTIAADEFLYVSDVVVCEAVWVLSISYATSRKQIATVLRKRFRARHPEFNAADQLIRALDAYASGAGDFADYLIREHARAANCESVATFDKALLRERGFVSLQK